MARFAVHNDIAREMPELVSEQAFLQLEESRDPAFSSLLEGADPQPQPFNGGDTHAAS